MRGAMTFITGKPNVNRRRSSQVQGVCRRSSDTMADRQRVLRLYRQILTLHRRKLDSRMRVLGDSYIRDEFRKHKDATPKFVPQFLHEWEQYAAMLSRQSDQFGRDLLESEKSLFNSEQKEKLDSLRDAAKSVGESW